jgi:hypothetical protein
MWLFLRYAIKATGTFQVRAVGWFEVEHPRNVMEIHIYILYRLPSGVKKCSGASKRGLPLALQTKRIIGIRKTWSINKRNSHITFSLSL